MPTILRKISVLVYQKNQTICKLKSNHVFFYICYTNNKLSVGHTCPTTLNISRRKLFGYTKIKLDENGLY